MSRRFVHALWREVPRMVNAISALESEAKACAGFAPGAVLPSGVRAAQVPCTGATFARPRAFWAVGLFGKSRMAADLRVALGQRNSGKQYPHTTRIAALSGDAEGPHPAREPV